MKILILSVLMLTSLLATATPPPANYPLVRGEIKKVDLNSGRATIKHETIPNLDMPGMTMSFLIKDPAWLKDLSAGDKIKFVVDEVDGDYLVLWLEKEVQPNLPIVKGVIRKIDLSNKRVSIKHEYIPNLDMPPMTMNFSVETTDMLNGLKVGDDIEFMVDEVDGKLMIQWIQKAASSGLFQSVVTCTGIAETTPRTFVEIEVRSDKYSTIRYEFAEGAYKGTAYINSIGRLQLTTEGDWFIHQNGDGPQATRLKYKRSSQQITEAQFSHFVSNMKDAPVNCRFGI